MDTQFTPHRIIAKDAAASITTIIEQHMPARSLLLVCDDETWIAAGERVRTQLDAAGYALTPYSLGRRVMANLAGADKLAAEATKYDGIIAVGSGTVNDMAKYAAAQAGKPYIIVATAASMNGYTSATSSLDQDGLKRSFKTVVPRAVVADTQIIATAPKRMTRAGLGDTLCRSVVEADMLLSHYLLGTDYPRDMFDMMRRHEAELIASATSAREANTAYAGTLMEALLDAGDAMAKHGSSAPASQGEHMIGHTLEMMYGSELRNLLHGELIAVTTLTMCHLQQKMLLAQPVVKSLPRELSQFDRQFGKKVGSYLCLRYAKKTLSAEQVADINARIAKDWAEMKAAFTEIMVSPNNIGRAFTQSGLATKPTDINLSEERYRNASNSAYLIRERFTFLDLAAMNNKQIV